MVNEPVPTAASNHPDSGTAEVQKKKAGNTIVLMAVAGIVATVVAIFAVPAIGRVFRLPPELRKLGEGRIPGPEDQAKLSAGNLILDYKHSVLWMSVVGGILGTSLGIARLVTGSGRGPGSALLLPAVAGAIGGAIAGPAGIRIEQSMSLNLAPGQFSMADVIPLAMHGVVWGIVGLGIGLGTTVGASEKATRKVESVTMTGVVALMGGAAYPLLSSFLMPELKTSTPIPEFEPLSGMFLWMVVPAVLIAVVSARQESRPSER